MSLLIDFYQPDPQGQYTLWLCSNFLWLSSCGAMAAASTEPKVAASEAHGDAETEAYF
jgi:hypothetical protein